MLVIRIKRCLACKSCELGCAIAHSESGELFGAILEQPASRSRVRVAGDAGFAMPLQCRQCETAPCMGVCPTKALNRSGVDDPIVLDHGLCIGCTWCVMACPFGVISLDEQRRAIVKCDQCFDLVQRGRLPACVTACPSGALTFQTSDDVSREKREACLVEFRRAAGQPGEAV
ncbi:MAG: 4Fe-4S binding protein [Candidatus Hydrogenedentes bacterium]|nr:4Fe-4S binding protein [Candidatus Hydrogenedentota bacterium]